MDNTKSESLPPSQEVIRLQLVESSRYRPDFDNMGVDGNFGGGENKSMRID